MTFSGKIGFGDRVSAEIVVLGEPGESLSSHVIDSPLAGKILICLSFMGREAMEKAGLVGVKGLVLPSIHFRDYNYLQNLNEFSVLVLTKFGKIKLGSEVSSKLSKLSSEKGILDGEEKKLIV